MLTPPTFSSPDALLAWLGESRDADGVAQKLRELGVKGEKSESCGCPVSVAIKNAGGVDPIMTPMMWSWETLSHLEAAPWEANWGAVDNRVEVTVKQVVAIFAARFDFDFYPDLIETS